MAESIHEERLRLLGHPSQEALSLTAEDQAALRWAVDEIGRLRAALEPFAAYVDLRGGEMPDETPMDEVLRHDERCPTLGDCRRAREAREGR